MINISKFHIYLDTNVLIYGNPFQNNLIKLINKYKGNNRLLIKLRIPEIVALEYKNKTRKWVREIINKQNETVKTINGFFNRKLKKLNISEDKLDKSIKKVFKSQGFELLKTPINKIDLKNLIIKAVDRQSPFQEKGEKGFRDSIISETIKLCSIKDKSVINIFISDDRLLNDFIGNNPAQFVEFKTFISINEFESYLDLHLLKYDDIFIERLTKKAELEFYDANSRSGLFFRENIELKIMRDYETILSSNPNMYPLTSLSSPSTSLISTSMNAYISTSFSPSYISSNLYNDPSKINYDINPPYFVSNKNLNEYTWNSFIFLKQPANYGENLQGTLTYVPITYGASQNYSTVYNTTTTFVVRWKTIIDDNGNITKSTFESLKLHNSNYISF